MLICHTAADALFIAICFFSLTGDGYRHIRRHASAAIAMLDSAISCHCCLKRCLLIAADDAITYAIDISPIFYIDE